MDADQSTTISDTSSEEISPPAATRLNIQEPFENFPAGMYVHYPTPLFGARSLADVPSRTILVLI